MSRRLPPTLMLPGDWPATYRIQPDAYPHLCGKCHQVKGKDGGCLCKAAKARLDRAAGGGTYGVTTWLTLNEWLVGHGALQ